MGVVQAVRHPKKTSSVQVFATNLKECADLSFILLVIKNI